MPLEVTLPEAYTGGGDANTCADASFAKRLNKTTTTPITNFAQFGIYDLLAANWVPKGVLQVSYISAYASRGELAVSTGFGNLSAEF